MTQSRILLVIGGGVAAYKALDLIRRLKERGHSVRAILTPAAAEFVTPLSVGTLTAEPVFQDLFDLTAEQDVGHIRLARDADLVVIAPATADLLAKMAAGLANDLASTALLATTAPVLAAPAMNPTMWAHPATRRNVDWLRGQGVAFVGPETGLMAERGESGLGRMSEPLAIVAAVEAALNRDRPQPLKGRRVLVTSGPTHEPIDPVRVLANRSSGRQGHALAAAAAAAGAEVTLVSGPVSIPDPAGVRVVKVESAREMQAAVDAALPADLAIFAAAVADWRVEADSAQKIKKGAGGPPTLTLVENPDILAGVARRAEGRPPLVVGFAAETENVIEHARSKLARKGCDLIVANDVSPDSGVMGGDRNTVALVSAEEVERWDAMSKQAVAEALVARFAALLGGTSA
ncbi:phosphopantothenate synthase [Methylopila jiangsuensis]|uniref:Coenzyme A biosynthesis bifunctional protein CoaBC n=1 Tax=Methylopila jiangsuensis TaxID=586230 RepID=A0A9W6N4R6_9HYPH|nr:bifunctional phosphopantothenoylcysteine decarboxylase/phosphopantothenate--cysteine ligase CoaBC [Methylopila jiangsuensis]MDR6285006.1 phosphopantothenoylcysteine decarboxylase/phosphopantothenate--cysteine ligase [Methylopila jiangsuensis]GLK77605.1 phosphopantothenate synthase [Methylopila jiangsuensis]